MTIAQIALLLYLGLVSVIIVQARVIQMQEEKIGRLESHVGSLYAQIETQGKARFLVRIFRAAFIILSAIAFGLACALLLYLIT